MNSAAWILAGTLLGLAGGAFAAFFSGRPDRAGKMRPLMLRLTPSLLALVLLLALFVMGDLMPGSRSFFLSFLLLFACGNAGAALGLSGRDPALLELAFVYRMPDLSRITAIDLPASFGMILRFAEAGGILAGLLSFADAARGKTGADIVRLAVPALTLIAAGELLAFFYRRYLKREGRL